MIFNSTVKEYFHYGCASSPDPCSPTQDSWSSQKPRSGLFMSDHMDTCYRFIHAVDAAKVVVPWHRLVDGSHSGGLQPGDEPLDIYMIVVVPRGLTWSGMRWYFTLKTGVDELVMAKGHV